MAAGVLTAAAHAGGETPRSHPLASRRRRARSAHAVGTPGAALGAFRIRVRSPGGLRSTHHFREDHAAYPARGRRPFRAGLSAGQVPPPREHAAAVCVALALPPLAALAARAQAGSRLRGLMSGEDDDIRTSVRCVNVITVCKYSVVTNDT